MAWATVLRIHRDFRFKRFLCPKERLCVRSTFFQTLSAIGLKVIPQEVHRRFFQDVGMIDQY